MNKFPENLPAKGTGKVDSEHRVAVLTEPEIQALNFLKNMDRSMGFRSGFSPMMQNLADQNTEPLDYVEYRGERIPSLNDFGSGAGKNEGAGESEAKQQTQSGGDYGGSNDWAARERARKQREEAARRQAEANKRAAEARYQEEQRKAEERQAKLKDIQDYLDWTDKVNQQGNTDYQDFEGENYGTDDRPEREPGWEPPEFGDEGYQEPPRHPDPDPDDPDPSPMTEGEFNTLVEELDLKPEFQAKDGEMYWTQAQADAVNARFDTARDTALGTLDTYGTENYGTDYMSGLAELYWFIRR